jgi:hypothetical protein
MAIAARAWREAPTERVTQVPSMLRWTLAEMKPGKVDATWSTISTLIRTTSSWPEGLHRKAFMKVEYSAPLTISGMYQPSSSAP